MFPSSQRSALISWLLHCGAILLILAATRVKTPHIPLLSDILVVPADLIAYKAPHPPGGGGGGGGVHADTPATRGVLPKFAREQLVPPRVRDDDSTPLLPVEPTLIGDPDIKPVAFNYKDWGDPNGVVGKPSGGPGDGLGIGSGHGTGIGPGNGPGHGPGEGGNEGGGKVGYLGAGSGPVTQPIVITKVEPEYSEDARKARLQGTVRLRIEVDVHGLAQNITVNRGLGLGLDDRAIEAVRKWRFVPGKLNGKPTTVEAYVDVSFRLL
ncbi:MAG TPA: energy transducer TonB [Bryobacteraceae bacterium]|jgi:TonB family protein|nr:energy transducer TonB [Bryobacteraceae bacterium]